MRTGAFNPQFSSCFSCTAVVEICAHAEGRRVGHLPATASIWNHPLEQGGVTCLDRPNLICQVEMYLLTLLFISSRLEL